MTSLGPGPQPQEAIFCLFPLMKPRRQSVSLEPLIGFLAYVVRKLRRKNNKLINYY